jgi:UDP-4-amino-4-deoxy-L-arabinose-oxoglutarate aminotransferase
MRETFLPYCKPSIGDAEIASVTQSMRNGWLTTGPQSAAFEREFAAASGVPFAVALNSCTAGLHLAFLALGIGPGDEIVMPSLTFVAGAQCALEIGARPIFCDVEPDTLSVSLRTIAPCITPRTKAIVTMPYAGRPLGIADLCDFARSRNIAIVEDAAHAAGMLDRGEWAGAHSHAAVYSFYATKNLTTGEGGMLVTHDEALAERVRRLSLHGMSRDAWKRYSDGGSWRYDVVEPGYKYNISDMASSVGLVQLARLPEMQARRDELAARYLAGLDGVPGISFQRAADNDDDRCSWCMFPILVDESAAGVDRDRLVQLLAQAKIGTSVHYIPTHSMSAYRKLPTAPLPATDAIAGQIMSLPLYPDMSDTDANDVVDAVRTCVAAAKTAV